MLARALIATIISGFMLFAGAVIVATFQQSDLAGAHAILAGREGRFACRLLAWGAVVAGALTLLASFAAFFDNEDDDGFRRRGFPKLVPLLLIAASLGFLWFAYACAARVEPPAPPPIVADPDLELDGGEPPSEPLEIDSGPEPEPEPLPPPTPAPLASETDFVWNYQYPLILNGPSQRSPAMEAALADLFTGDAPGGLAREAFCGAAWTAVTGAASEEGPRARNLARSRLRAELAAKAAARWLDRQDENCPRPVLLAVDLGQHAPTGADEADGGRHTGYQRQILIISRATAEPTETVSAEEAAEELRALLRDDPASVLGARVYSRAPAIFAPALD